MAADVAIKLEEVSLRLGARWTLVRLSAEFARGRKVLLTGDNGAGKTTLLRVMATALRPTRGRLSLHGVSAWDSLEVVREQVGIVTHNSFLYEQLSARENLELVSRLSGCSSTPIDELLERVKLSADAHRPVGQYSAGMKRRVALARLMLRKPQICLLDEPFGQLDPEGVEMVEGIVRELSDGGRTIVIATHDHDRGRALCDQHLQLSAGRRVGDIEVLS